MDPSLTPSMYSVRDQDKAAPAIGMGQCRGSCREVNRHTAGKWVPISAMLFPNGKTVWIPAASLRPYHSLGDPAAKCAPALDVPTCLQGFDYSLIEADVDGVIRIGSRGRPGARGLNYSSIHTMRSRIERRGF